MGENTGISYYINNFKSVKYNSRGKNNEFEGGFMAAANT
jgi:hypothetical protein